MGMRLLYSFVLKIKRNRSKIYSDISNEVSEFYFVYKSQKVRMFHVKHSVFFLCIVVKKPVLVWKY